jgi:hypothetical protein
MTTTLRVSLIFIVLKKYSMMFIENTLVLAFSLQLVVNTCKKPKSASPVDLKINNWIKPSDFH